MNKSLALKMFGVLSSQPPIEIWHLYLSCVMNMIHLSQLIKWVSSHTHTHTHKTSEYLHTHTHTHTHTQKPSELCALPIAGYMSSFY